MCGVDRKMPTAQEVAQVCEKENNELLVKIKEFKKEIKTYQKQIRMNKKVLAIFKKSKIKI